MSDAAELRDLALRVARTVAPEILRRSGRVAVESTKFVLDLKKEHHEQYARKIHGMAEKAGFRPKTTFNPEKDAIARFSFVEDDSN